MGMMLQVIWQLMHLLLVLCIIAIATVVPRSSGLTDPLSLESFSPISSIEAQVPNSILARGPLLNAPTVRPSIESPSINSPPVQQTNQGPLPFLSPRKLITPPPQHDLTTPTPTQATHDSAPPLSAKPTNYPTFPTARAPRDSSPAPVAEISVGLAPPLPVSEPPPDSTPPPNDDNSNNWSMAPTVSPHASAVSPKAKPPEAMPQLPTAEPPKTSSVASLARPPEVSQPTSTIRPPPIVEAPVISTPVPVVAPSHSSPQSPVTESPHNIPLPLAVKPPESKPPLSFAEPPQGLTLTPPPTEAPPLLPFPPPAMPPHISDMQSPPDPPNASASHASPAEVSQPTSTMQPPPISAAEAPVVSTQPPVANPPHSSALPLAAKPPESKPPLPVAEPPQITLTPNLPFLPPVPGNASSSPPYTYSPPPQSGLPHAPSPTFTVPSNPSLLPPSMAPPSQKPPTTSPSPSPPLPPDTLTPPPQLNPPILSSPPPQLTPPVLSSPPPQLNPPNASSPPPEMNPPTASSPPPQPNPPIVSSPPHQLNPPNVSAPPPQSKPPVASSPPPEVNPPIVSAPPPQLNPPQISSPPPQMNPPLLSAPPPQLNPPIVSSPPPELNQPSVSSPPPELKLPIVSSPAPEMNSPSVTSSPPEVDPPNVMSPPPELNPPSVLSPPPKLNPPIISSPPPKLVPPTLSSPPQLIPPPASRPTSVVPPNSAVPPPLIVPPPKLSSPPPAVSPHASAMLSPPLPSHASPPLGQLVPPYASSPPYVLPTPPPLELPHISPPRSHIVPGSVPPHVSPPSPFLAPPFSLTSPVNPSHPLYAPPPIESSHSSAPPPVTRRTAPAAPPHPSQSEEPQERASPPSPTSSEPSPPSKTLPDGAPPAHQVTQRSHPPSSHQIEAPKRAPFLRSNASEPDMSPTSTPPRKTRISGRKSSTAPPGRAPEQSPRDNLSPNHDDPYKAPSKPRVERHNASAPAPFPSKVNPTHIGSNHSLHHSWVKGSPQAMAPIPSLPEIPEISSAPSPLPGMTPPDHYGTPFLSPKISPSGSSTRDKKKPLAPPIMSLPPPPPNADCEYLTCPEPFTNTPPGSPCGCVWPMQVGLRLSVALFTFFPLVSELAREVAAGLFMKDSQVRVMGANAASSQSEKTIVLVDLVPLNEKFDNVTSYMTFQRFWQKQVVIDKSIFGEYDVLYVRYPGLPPSPPMAPADMAVINGMPYSVRDPNQSKVHPLGVDVPKQRHKHRLNGIVIAAIVLSAIVGVLICCSVAWVLVLRHKTLDPQPAQTPRALPSISRLSGPTGNSTGSGPSSSLSIGSSLATYAGSAKTFSTNEIEKATDNLSPSRIIGEGGFGLVYSGVLEDETRVAVKVLKRDDQQGGREFLAEVEMLSRLHHRNLVKLIGICTDEHLRCLVYELIPNGSVDSHLHGTDKEIAPLDWASRMKIALGAARGLAYLHEDSSPRVIHRDFKSSNILLENDFTPKVSDFGLARSAMDEENKHISTRVMGTFGYVAPEYAMTGHLLVKSDVYSYGVVLLELLTGRKPVDMSQPPGQENIVAWTRPYLSTKEGLALILDPSIESDVHLDSVIKVAAIASMCVQPEVSHRPFMGEVVQALKLVCNECDDSKEGNSRPGSRENLSVDFEAKASPVSETQYLPTQFSHQNFLPVHDVEKGLSVSEIFSSARVDRQTSDSFGTRRHSASGPLKTVRGQQFWQRIGRRSNGSVSEHGIMYRLWAGSH